MDARQRQDTLVRTLRRNGSATVGGLAEQVGASRRTVLRDIAALRDEGYVIHAECGRGGGLQLDPQSLHRAQRLSVAEVFALIVTVSATQAARALPFAGLADAGLAKIEKSLPGDRVRDLRRLLGCLHVGRISPYQDLSGMGAMEDSLLPAFETAFLDCRMLRFGYADAKGSLTLRTVEPQAMLILPPLWYLVCWDPDREGFRHFRMDRISGAEVLHDLPFRRRHVPFEDDVCPFPRPGPEADPGPGSGPQPSRTV